MRHNKEGELRHMSHNDNHVFHRSETRAPKYKISSSLRQISLYLKEIIILSFPELLMFVRVKRIKCVSCQYVPVYNLKNNITVSL